MPRYTYKMANVSWPQILWRHFTLCIGRRRGARVWAGRLLWCVRPSLGQTPAGAQFPHDTPASTCGGRSTSTLIICRVEWDRSWPTDGAEKKLIPLLVQLVAGTRSSRTVLDLETKPRGQKSLALASASSCPGLDLEGNLLLGLYLSDVNPRRKNRYSMTRIIKQ